MIAEIENRVALITGAGRGIGREIALELAKKGITVCLTARTESQVLEVVEEIEKRGYDGFATGYIGDVQNPDELYKIVKEIYLNFGRIDILVNNAGVANGGIPLADDDPKRWWSTMEINLRGQ